MNTVSASGSEAVDAASAVVPHPRVWLFNRARGVPASALLAAGLILGVLGDALFRVPPPPGLNVPLWVAAVAIVASVLQRRLDGRRDRTRVGWLAVAVLFAAGVAWRDSHYLKPLAIGCVTLAFAVAAYRAGSAWVRRTGVTTYLVAWTMGALHAWTAGVRVLLQAWQSLPAADPARVERRRRASGVARGLAIAVPLVFVFGALFMSADEVFAGLVQSIFRLDVERLGSHVLLTWLCGWVATGYLSGFLTGTEPQLDDVLRSLVPKRPSLAITEVVTALSAVAVLFLLFVVVQFRYLFGGDALVQVTPELTYAEYARGGFFELVVAVALVVPVLLAADWLLVRERRGDDLWFRVLAGVQIVLVLAIAASAFQRLRLYHASYGLTEARFYATALLLWIGAMLVWFAATVLRGRRDRFAFGALASSLAAVAVLFAINPDAIIARTNVARLAAAEAAVRFDVAYATTLSGDAVPVLLEALPALPPDVQCPLARHLLRRWPLERQPSFRGWSWSDSRASAAVRANAPMLSGLAGADQRCARQDGAQGQRSAPRAATVAAAVESVVRARLAHPQGPASVSVAIVQNGETLVQQAWGTADASTGRAAHASMTYRIGSISKQFTAALVLKLVDRGALTLSDSVGNTLGTHVTGLRPEWRSITIEQLLNHTSGLPRDYRHHVLPALQSLLTQTDDARISWAARDEMVSAPGTTHLYSNTGYMLLGVLVEKLYGKPYAEALRDEISRPLGLTTLGPCMAPAKRATETVGHIRSPRGELQSASELMTDLLVGGGGLCATAADLARWNAALHGGRVLSNASYDAMITPRGAAVGEHYGFGIRSFRMTWGGPVLTHDGTTIAFVSENSWFPDEALSVSVLYNSTVGPGTSPLAAQLARVALGHTAPTAAARTITAGPEAVVGFYEGRPGRGVTVTLENGALYAEPTGARKTMLVPHGERQYFVGRQGSSTQVTFVIGADGHVTGMTVREGTLERTFAKVR